MGKTLYRDQVDRFYDLEEAEYSTPDVASLCDISLSLVKVWRRTCPHPDDFEPRPSAAMDLPVMREKKPVKGGSMPGWLAPDHKSLRGKRPPPRGQDAAEQEKAPEAVVPLPEIPGGSPSAAAPARRDPPKMLPAVKPKPGLPMPEARPPGGKAAAARNGALRPVTRGQLDKAVAREVAAQRAEILKEVKAAGFDPAVTWTTEVNHEAFDPVRALVQLAHVPGCPEPTILGVLKELTRLRKERAKVAWDQVELADIPVEHRPRLAGQLVEWLEVAELPVEVQDHDAVREVYELTGVALPRPADADAFLARWEQVLEDMRTDAEARVESVRASGVLVMDGPPKRAAEFRVRPSTGSPSV